MAKFNFGFVFILAFTVSCSVEKINLSPVGDSFTGQNQTRSVPAGYGIKKNLIVYSSEISNLIASFPKFRNDAVNAEVSSMKVHLKDYLGAMEAYNINGLNSSQRKFEKSYKKIQKLRKYLNPDDDQVLNRYLVRIKTNISLLESNIPQDSLSSGKN